MVSGLFHGAVLLALRRCSDVTLPAWAAQFQREGAYPSSTPYRAMNIATAPATW